MWAVNLEFGRNQWHQNYLLPFPNFFVPHLSSLPFSPQKPCSGPLMTSPPPPVSPVSTVSDVVKKEVADWDDEVVATARFKAFSGQRSDWEPRFLFWRDLILKVARSLGVCVIRASELKNTWFSRGGLTPLCMDQVLHEMHVNGDILLRGELTDPTSGSLYRFLRRAGQIVGTFKLFSAQDDTVILRKPLQEKAADVIKTLTASNWTSTLVITMKNFHYHCKGPDESFAILSYLCESRKALYLSLRKEFVEGVKLSLASATVNAVTDLDYDILHLMWTTEMLQQQVDTVNQQWETSRKMALASLSSGNKQAACRYIRQAKLFSEKRSKCTSFLERVEEVLAVIADAESTKKVSEAMQIGARAIKENSLCVEEVNAQLLELEDYISDQKQISKALERVALQSVDFEDEDVEKEFEKLELELADEMPQPQVLKPATAQKRVKNKKSAELLSQNLSKLNLEAAQLE